MTETEARQVKRLAGQAMLLGQMLDQKRISQEEYYERLNSLRREVGLAAIEPDCPHRPSRPGREV